MFFNKIPHLIYYSQSCPAISHSSCAERSIGTKQKLPFVGNTAIEP